MKNQENNFNETKDILRVKGIKSKGYGIIPKIVMQDKRLTIEAKAIYSYFCTYAGAGNIAFPSVEKTCFDLSVSEERYRKHFKFVVQYGYITVEQQRENGKFARNIYTLEEHPIEVDTHKSPTPENQGTVNSSMENLGCNINTRKINTTNNNQSVSQSDKSIQQIEETDDGLIDKIKNEIKEILDNAQVELYTTKLFIESVIRKLYSDSTMPIVLKMGLTQQDIRARLKMLTNRTIDTALLKLKDVKKNKEIYFAKCLLTAVIEVNLDDYIQEIQDD